MSDAPPAFTGRDVEVLTEEAVHDGFFPVRRLRLRHRLFAGGWSRPLQRELILRRDAVGLLPYDPVRDCVVLVEQFRVGALRDPESPWLLELVAGLVEPNETLEAVALREAQEEAGLQVMALERIAAYYSSPGGSSERFTAFCGRVDAGQGGLFGLAEEGEDIRSQVIPVAELDAWLDQGRIRNVHTFAAVQWLLRHCERLRRQWRAEA